MTLPNLFRLAGLCCLVSLATACSHTPELTSTAAGSADAPAITSEYLIGPGDMLNVFVWRNPEISVTVPVRPDGRISTPLVEDMLAVGKSPSQLARDIEKSLSDYIRGPVVTVIVTQFVGPSTEQIRVIGQAGTPRGLPYRQSLTLLDVIIEVGGLTDFASGNKSRLIRRAGGQQQVFRVRLDDLVKKGDISANMEMQPGDILIIPESLF